MRLLVALVACSCAFYACSTEPNSTAGNPLPGTQSGASAQAGTSLSPAPVNPTATGGASGKLAAVGGQAGVTAGIGAPADWDAGGSDPSPGDAAVADAASPGDTTSRPQLGITADFLNQTLTVFDLNKLTAGAKRSDVTVASIDLGKYSPGPLSLGIAPDGKTAIVSISAGFLGAFITVPPGDGTLVFIDLEKFVVKGELFTGKSPMGVSFSQDSKRAFVGHFSENYFAVVDVEKRTFEKVPTGGSYNEEFAIDDSGAVGALSYGAAGNIKTFSVADPAKTLGQTSGLTGDAAGVAFFPGTKIAYLVQAPTTLTGNVGGHNLVDVSDPLKPVSSDNVRSNNHPTVYPITAVAARNSVVFPATENKQLSVIEMKLDGAVARENKRVAVGPAESLAYGVAATPDGRVLVATSGEHVISVVDLESGTSYGVPWEVSKSGPTEVKLIPRAPDAL